MVCLIEPPALLREGQQESIEGTEAQLQKIRRPPRRFPQSIPKQRPELAESGISKSGFQLGHQLWEEY
jgi:hypothetical protein